MTLTSVFRTIPKHMSNKELTLVPVRDRIPAGRDLNISIDGTESPANLIKKLHEYCSGYARVTVTGDKILFYIAKIAVMIKDTEAFRPAYDSFTQFVDAEIIEKHGIASGSVWSYISSCATIPNLSVRQANDIGITKLVIATRAIKKDAIPQSKIQKMIKDAEQLSADEFEERYPAGEDGRAGGYGVIRLPKVSKKTITAFWKWMGDRNPDRVIQHVMKQVPELPADV